MSSPRSILAHACCASCSSYVLAHLAGRFSVTAYFYNPNIEPEEEYRLRLAEMSTVCGKVGIPLIAGPYDVERWRACVAPLRELPEKSERCWACYRIRLAETARKARELGLDLVTTTLSVSPHKVFARIASIGAEEAARHGALFLSEDFKKRDGFKISVTRSKELGLTRQDYCGCSMSLEESKRRR